MTKYPASLIQEQFWLINKLQPNNPAYNIPSLFYLKGNLNIEALKKSLDEIVCRHDIYRTTFSREGNQLYQIVEKETKLTLQSVKLNNIVQKEKKNQINYLVHQKITTPFDLANGPLLSVTLFYLGEQEYVLLLMMHHVITDLRSKQLFALELSALYTAFDSNKPIPLSTPTQQYKDFASWQHKWLKEEQCYIMGDYWQRSLKDYSGYLNLPTDIPRPPVHKISGNACSFHLSKYFTTSLKKFSQSKTSNIFLILLTTYYILLFRYTDQNDIIAGVPLTNRRKDIHKNIAGCFVNILPIAIRISGNQNFEAVLKQIRQAMLGAHRNQELPFDSIFKKLLPQRDLSFNPLFQTGFTFEPPMELDLYNIEITPEKIHNQGAQLDLFFTLWEKDEEIQGFVEFNTELFEESTINRLISCYEALLQEIVSHPEDTINSLNILSEEEKYQQVVHWNSTDTDLPSTPLLHKAFEKQAVKTPDSIAIISESSQLSYRQLNNRANQLAHYLQSHGINSGSFVGVFMDRSLDMIVALYAILKAGGAYVPLDPAFPQDRIAYMLEDANLKFIITKDTIADQLPDHDSEKILIDTAWASIKNEANTNPETKLSPNNLAYVIYTSGSTGKPKGVQVPHKAVVNFLISMSQRPGITDKDTLLAVTTLSFDISVLELFLPLTIGAKIVIANQKTSSNGELLLDLLYSSKATIMQATPTTWYLLIAAGWKGSQEFKILCGGEPLPFDMAYKLTKRSSSAWNMYGPTETTIWSTCCQLTDKDVEIQVGKPIANTQVYIVNKDNQPNPIGVAGEMLIGGTGVTCGYLNRPNLTQKMFIPDIFRKNSSPHKLYKTGDMACYLPDGSIKVLGRIDNQIKLRGYRIELGEIETVLENHPSIKQAASIVREDEPGDKRLVGYSVINQGYLFSGIELQKYLKTKLPEYMVPSIFIQIETMPLTLNGKINRRALPKPDRKRESFEQIFSPPKTKIEKTLSKLWSKTLKIDEVGIHDNFFDMGGNSMLSVQLVGLLEEKLGITIPIVKFYQYPTIDTLSQYVSSKQTPLTDSVNNPKKRAQQQRQALAKRHRMSPRK